MNANLSTASDLYYGDFVAPRVNVNMLLWGTDPRANRSVHEAENCGPSKLIFLDALLNKRDWEHFNYFTWIQSIWDI